MGLSLGAGFLHDLMISYPKQSGRLLFTVIFECTETEVIGTLMLLRPTRKTQIIVSHAFIRHWVSCWEECFKCSNKLVCKLEITEGNLIISCVRVCPSIVL